MKAATAAEAYKTTSQTMPPPNSANNFDAKNLHRPPNIQTIKFLCIVALGLLFLMTYFPMLSRLNNGHCDAWYYFGPMISPSEIPPYWGRIMLSAPFNFLSIPFGMEFLEQVFFLSTMFASIACLYVGLTTFFHPLAAATSVTVTMLSAFSLSVASATYSSPALAYGCAAFALFARSLTAKSLLGQFTMAAGTGIFLAFAANCHLASLLVFGPIVAFSLIGNVSRSQPPIMTCFVSFFALSVGSIAGIAITCIISQAILGDPWSPLRQIFAATSYYFEGSKNYDPGAWEVEGWWRLNGVTAIGFLMLICAMKAVLDIRKASGNHRVRVAFLIVGAGIYGFALAMNFAGKMVFMKWSYYINWYAVPVAFVTCAFLQGQLERTKSTDQRITIHQFALVAANCIFFIIFWHLKEVGYRGQIVLCLITGCIIIATHLRGYAAAACMALVFFALPATFQSIRSAQYGSNFWSLTRDERTAALYSTIKEAVGFIAHAQPNDDRVFWISETSNPELRTGIFRSFGRCGFSTDFPNALPDAALHWQSKLKPGQTLAIIMAPNEEYRSADKTLASAGLTLDMEAARVFSNRPYEVKIEIGKLRATP